MAKTGTGAGKSEKEKLSQSKCIVEFRPENSWKGEFGFDWFRTGDYIENVNGANGNSRYNKGGGKEAIVGKYAPDDPDYGDNAQRRLVIDANNKQQYYVDLLARTEYVPFQVYKIQGRNYLIPCLSLFSKEDIDTTNKKFSEAKTEAQLRLVIEAQNIEKIVFVSQDTNLLKIDPVELAPVSDGKSENKTITVKCLKRFSQNITIEVHSISKQTKENRLVGKLTVFKNAYKEVDVVFVNVKTNLSGGNTVVNGLNANFAENQTKLLRKFLSQPLIICKNIRQYDLNLAIGNIRQTFNNNYSIRIGKSIGQNTVEYGRIVNKYSNSGGMELANYLESLMPSEYQNYYKIFFLGEYGGRHNTEINRTKIHDVNNGKTISFLGGHAKNIPSKVLVMYRDPDPSTVTHEIMHCFGLYHSFSNEGKHTFLKDHTSNIMDYSKDTTTTWQWQWEKMHEKIY